MPYFSATSKEKLQTCNSELIRLAGAVIQLYDFSIIWGYRSYDEQLTVFAKEYSNCPPGTSKHNHYPSEALDFLPYPFSGKWDLPANRERFILIAGAFMAFGRALHIPIRWGGDWDTDGNIREHSLQDLGHIECL